MKWLGSRVFVLYVSLNMLFCAICFFPWAHPRETVSGLVGRWLRTEKGWKKSFARYACIVVNRIYFWEPGHCDSVHDVEMQARHVLYPEQMHPKRTNGLLHP